MTGGGARALNHGGRAPNCGHAPRHREHLIFPREAMRREVCCGASAPPRLPLPPLRPLLFTHAAARAIWRRAATRPSCRASPPQPDQALLPHIARAALREFYCRACTFFRGDFFLASNLP